MVKEIWNRKFKRNAKDFVSSASGILKWSILALKRTLLCSTWDYGSKIIQIKPVYKRLLTLLHIRDIFSSASVNKYNYRYYGTFGKFFPFPWMSPSRNCPQSYIKQVPPYNFGYVREIGTWGHYERSSIMPQVRVCVDYADKEQNGPVHLAAISALFLLSNDIVEVSGR